MSASCPKCHRSIPLTDVNVATDVAICRACNSTHKFSELLQGVELEEGVDFTRPPAGAWYRDSGVGTMVVGATHRSVGAALGLLAFSIFWNGIVSVFVGLALSGTLALLDVPRPAWFPIPKMNGGAMGWGIVAFLWLFLTPFILIGLAMLGGFVMALGGRTEVTLRNGAGEIYTGIGSLGRRKRFNAQLVKQTGIEDRRWRDSDGDRRRSRQIVLELENGKPIKFGSTLTPERMRFVAAALRKALKT